MDACQVQGMGLDAQIETSTCCFPRPKSALLELIEPTQFTAKLQEPTVAVDPLHQQHAEQLPTYNAYSIDGDVTAPLVYVNYGMPEDYEELDRLGVSVKGAIVIARYGSPGAASSPRSRPSTAPSDASSIPTRMRTAISQGDVFPEARRPKDGVQRGSVMDMPVYPGDPLTPGVGATKDAKRLPMSEVTTLTKIPVLPISYADAQPLLAALEGPVAPDELARRLCRITYHVGPGRQVH